MSRPILFADDGCPFAHRVLLFAELAGVELDLRTAPLGSKPDGLRAYSPSERIPLLVHDGLVLTESRVIVDYLADLARTPGMPTERMSWARHNHAIALVDETLTPFVMDASAGISEVRVEEALTHFDEVVSSGGDTLRFATHILPIWMRLHVVRPDHFVVSSVRSRPSLSAWLDRQSRRAEALRCSPSASAILSTARRAFELGLVDRELWDGEAAG